MNTDSTNFHDLELDEEEMAIINAIELKEGEFFTTGEGYDWLMVNEQFNGAEALDPQTEQEVAFHQLARERYGDYAPMILTRPDGSRRPSVTREADPTGFVENVYITRMFETIEAGIEWLRKQPLITG